VIQTRFAPLEFKSKPDIARRWPRRQAWRNLVKRSMEADRQIPSRKPRKSAWRIFFFSTTLLVLAAWAVSWILPRPLPTSGGLYFPARLLINGPHFLQNDPQWADDPLGNTPDSLRDVGCAVASAAMALGTHGITTDPGALNAFLKKTKAATRRRVGFIGRKPPRSIQRKPTNSSRTTRICRRFFSWIGASCAGTPSLRGCGIPMASPISCSSAARRVLNTSFAIPARAAWQVFHGFPIFPARSRRSDFIENPEPRLMAALRKTSLAP